MHHLHWPCVVCSYTKAELARQKMLLVCVHGPCMSTIYICTSQPSQCIMYKSLSSLLKICTMCVHGTGWVRTYGTHMPLMAMITSSLHACLRKRCYTAFSICLVVVFCSSKRLYVQLMTKHSKLVPLFFYFWFGWWGLARWAWSLEAWPRYEWSQRDYWSVKAHFSIIKVPELALMPVECACLQLFTSEITLLCFDLGRPSRRWSHKYIWQVKITFSWWSKKRV